MTGTLVTLGGNNLAFISNDLKVYALSGAQPECISNRGLEERICSWFRSQQGLTP